MKEDQPQLYTEQQDVLPIFPPEFQWPGESEDWYDTAWIKRHQMESDIAGLNTVHIQEELRALTDEMMVTIRDGLCHREGYVKKNQSPIVQPASVRGVLLIRTVYPHRVPEFDSMPIVQDDNTTPGLFVLGGYESIYGIITEENNAFIVSNHSLPNPNFDNDSILFFTDKGLGETFFRVPRFEMLPMDENPASFGLKINRGPTVHTHVHLRRFGLEIPNLIPSMTRGAVYMFDDVFAQISDRLSHYFFSPDNHLDLRWDMSTEVRAFKQKELIYQLMTFSIECGISPQIVTQIFSNYGIILPDPMP